MAEDTKSTETARQAKTKAVEEQRLQEQRDKNKQKANDGLLNSFKKSFMSFFEEKSDDAKRETKESRNFLSRVMGDSVGKISEKFDNMESVWKSIGDKLDSQWKNFKSAFSNFVSVFTNNPIFGVISGIVVGFVQLWKWIRGNGKETADNQKEGNSWLKRIYSSFMGNKDAELTAEIEAQDRHEELIRILKEQGAIFGAEDEKTGFFERFQEFVVAGIMWWGKIVVALKSAWVFIKSIPTLIKTSFMRSLAMLQIRIFKFTQLIPDISTNIGKTLGKFGKFLKKLPIIGALFGVIEGVFFDATRIFGDDVPYALRIISGGVRALTGFFLALPAMVIDWFGGLFGLDLGATELVDKFTDELIILFKNMFDLLMGYITGSDVLKEAAIKGITEFSDKVVNYFAEFWHAIKSGLSMLFDNLPDWMKPDFLGGEEKQVAENPKIEKQVAENLKEVNGIITEPKSGFLSNLFRTSQENEMRGANLNQMSTMGAPEGMGTVINYIQNTNATQAPQASYSGGTPLYGRNDDDSLQSKMYAGLRAGGFATYGIRG